MHVCDTVFTLARGCRDVVIHVGHQMMLFFLAQAHFCEDRNLGELSVLREVASGHGIDAESLVQSSTASQRLRDNTAEVVERGGFGVPR